MACSCKSKQKFDILNADGNRVGQLTNEIEARAWAVRINGSYRPAE